MSGLMRMANHSHPQIDVHDGDTVILSASPVPGNEKMVSRLINQLFRCGAEVVYSALADVHVSGHACQDELKLIHTLIKPKYFMPVHGEYRHLKQHVHLAQSLGMPAENTCIGQIGHVVEFTRRGMKQGEVVPSGEVLVDGLGIGDVGNVVLRDRRILSQDGLVICILAISREMGEVISGPEIISRGFVYVKESEDMMAEIRHIALDIANDGRNLHDGDWNSLKGSIRSALSRYLYERTKRSPMILPVIVEI